MESLTSERAKLLCQSTLKCQKWYPDNSAQPIPRRTIPRCQFRDRQIPRLTNTATEKYRDQQIPRPTNTAADNCATESLGLEIVD